MEGALGWLRAGKAFCKELVGWSRQAQSRRWGVAAAI